MNETEKIVGFLEEFERKNKLSQKIVNKENIEFEKIKQFLV